MSEARINKSELEAIGRALRANVKAARATIIALGPKLKAEFEVQLMSAYSPDGDPVWKDALVKLYACYEEQQARVKARCEELHIPEKFQPRIQPPGWADSWRASCFDFKDMRAELRRLAGIQIDDMLKSRLAQLELDSANVQFEIASHGCITEAAREFLGKLPSMEALVPPVKVSEIEALIEGRPGATADSQNSEQQQLINTPRRTRAD